LSSCSSHSDKVRTPDEWIPERNTKGRILIIIMSSTSSPSLHFYTLTMSAVYCYMLCTSPLVNDFVGQRFLLLSSSPNKMDVTRSERLSENCLSCLRVRRTSSQTPKDEIYCHLLSQNCSSTVSSTRRKKLQSFISTSTGISVMQLNIQVIGWIKQRLLVKEFVCQFVNCVIGLELNIAPL